ncbi:Rrf2 family transcriptional regulator [Levilactobacillus brevis]|uniref:Rrf2 family transcriptional regulator n=1 Tax=Levilactobacillus brevis TaxID=1580 RepID=UPI000A20AF23|nr:Rrf2 family transcriptional regulator [Levilactobacillus brevis]ARN89117.1 hypothetical protein AZI09_00200 [Levilactobacillus brevis]ARN96695.1 hypothetical protein AZI10_00200 [Levilactobacillus brevis]
MKYSMRFSDTIHVLSYIEIYHGIAPLTSQAIATSVETNPANVRKIMVDLRRANLIKTVVGKAQPTLAKAPEKITLLDIFNCLDEDTQLIQVDPKTNPNCIVGGNIQTVLDKKYQEFQSVVLAEMKKTTLADILHEVAQEELRKRPENRDVIARFL